MEVSTILALVAFAIQEEPKVADSLKKLFAKGDPTPADWDAEIAETRAQTYGNLVPNSQLPPEPPAA